jgi:peroxiredoxin
MKNLLFLFLAFLSFGCREAEELAVYAFLGTECPLSREQTLALTEAHAQWGEKVQFYGVFPNKSDSPETIHRFAEKYKLPFSLIPDHQHQLTDSLQATVTPEVILLTQNGKVLYAGQIDNRMQSLGVKRKVVTQHYLQDAIAEAVAGQEITIKKTKGIGCRIFSNL